MTVDEAAARIAELEAERDMWKHACKSWEEQNVRLVSLVAKTETERDKLKATLLPLAEIGSDELFLGRADYRVPVSMVLLRACRAALSGEGSP